MNAALVYYVAANAIIQWESDQMKTTFKQEASYVFEDALFDNPFKPMPEDYYLTMGTIAVLTIVGLFV